MATSREGSAAPSSEGDTIDDSRLTVADVDDTASASDLPARTATPSSTRGTKRPRSGIKRPRPKKGTTVFVNEGVEGTEDESTPVRVKRSGSAEPDVIKSTGTAVGTRRQANGTVGSVYSGSKIRHIKKADGVPLWREEIQYAFLDEVVRNEERCFTRLSDKKKDCTFAEIYIDSMARSSKASKILKDRLMVDTAAAQNMAMICLLVNVGRMNTTLNFFPEMRAQLRTYHPIPALQAYPTQKDYKSLQDAPRLKSILKGASEDEEQPRSLAQLRAVPVPRCNPVNLIFVLSQTANEISQLHFLDKVDFFDLAIRSTISSHSRAVAFLWLMWWYLESDFTKEAALSNPFGPGEYKEGEDPSDPNTIPLLVPKLEHITEEQGNAENVDPPEEIEFGTKMTKERERLNAENAEHEAAKQAGGFEDKRVKRLKRSARDSDNELDSSDVDSMRASPAPHVRSPAPGDTPSVLMGDGIDDDMELLDAHPGKGRYKRVKGKNTPSKSKGRFSDIGSVSRLGGRSRLGIASDRGTPDTLQGTPQPMPPGPNHPVLSQYGRRSDANFEASYANVNGSTMSKSRARTGYQRELEEHKQRRIDWLISKKRRDALNEEREKHDKSKRQWIIEEMYRISRLDATYDSEEDDSASFGLSLIRDNECPTRPHNGTGLGGILPVKKSLETHSNSSKRDRDASPESGAAERKSLAEPHDDLGLDAERWRKTFKRASRRLFRWSADKDVEDSRRIKQRQAFAAQHPVDDAIPRVRPLSRGSIAPVSSIVGSTPRKSRKDLDDEIERDILREEDTDDEDEDGDTKMTGHIDVAN